MNYEIHITVNITDIDKFKSDCESIGLKAIVIETENNSNFENQVMTSSKHSGDDYKPKLDSIVCKLQELGYTILRQKVEIEPCMTRKKHPDHLYYETHFRLKLPIGFDLDFHKNDIKSLSYHLSKNVFKKDDTHYYQMITYRNRKSEDYFYFMFFINMMSRYLKYYNIKYDKIEIEECIYDTNVSVDQSWLYDSVL